MRIFARLEKGDKVRFVSHLDMQRLIQRALRRANIPMSYSCGFNPHPLLSFATALPVGQTSSAEWLDIHLEKNIADSAFLSAMNSVLPKGYRIAEAFEAEDKLPALSAMMCGAEYTVTLSPDYMEERELTDAVDKLLSGPVMVEKRTKGGLKTVDIRPQVNAVRLLSGEGLTLCISGQLDASGSLSCELLLQKLYHAAGNRPKYALIHRDKVLFTEMMQPLAAF